MNVFAWLQLILYLVVLLLAAKPLGAYMAHVYQGDRTFLDPLLRPVERLIYRASGVRADDDMNWKTYAVAMLLFNVIGLLVVYALQRAQALLPLNPMGLGAITPDSSWNTAVSFATNTNWQGYGGEVTMSYFTQMAALAVQNFVSAATGMAVLVALIRGIVRHTATGIGNFWVDMTRSTLYILLPLSLLLAVVLVSQGVVQTFGNYQTVTLLQPTADGDGNAVTEQVLALGPAASQIAIKQLGTNGGGFFNVNSAHPFENPTPLSNLLEMLAILIIPAALCYTYGKMVGDTRQGWALLTAMTLIFVVLLGVAVWAEQSGNPAFASLGIDQRQSHPTPEQRRLMEAFASQASLAIERAQLAEAARQAQVLQATEKLQTALLNSISHDLRTPLVSITGALSSLKDDGSRLDETARNSLVLNAYGEADRLNRLVGNLLDMTRLEAGALHVLREPGDVQDVIGAALDQLGDWLGDRKITVDVPAGAPLVPMDFVLIARVLVNLLDNALKYSPPSTPIDLRAHVASGHVEIEVSDRGQGVPSTDLARIFDKFYRVQQRANVGGTGLGLSICKGIIEAHGGFIVAENRPDGGTRMTFALPIETESAGMGRRA